MGRPIVLHDSLTGVRSELPAPGGSEPLRLYLCGPTVYDDPHVGNFRTFVSYDILRRALGHFGYRFDSAMNLTDVDDKIIRRAAEQGIAPAELAARYEERFLEDQAAIGIVAPDHLPKATEHVDAMIDVIARLIEGGAAYVAPDGSVYFRVRSYPGYGQLSGQNLDAIRSGARVESEPGKEDDADFALWKAYRPGEPWWASPWGRGRPGWHIECTAMAERVLGRPLDVHGGGADLAFPHHENERAQAEALGEAPFSRRWVHMGMLLVDGTKASKSLNNIGSFRALREQVDPMAIRMLFLQAHYAHPLSLTGDALDGARAALGRVRDTALRVHGEIRSAERTGTPAGDLALAQTVGRARDAFDQGLADDLNAPAAGASLFDLGRALNQAVADPGIGSDALRRALAAYVDLWGVLGIDVRVGQDARQERAAEVEHLVQARQQARARRDFAEADRIRAELDAMGVAIEDTRDGARWRWLEERV